MSINNGYDEKTVTEAIATALETFYNNLIAKIDELNITENHEKKKSIFVSCKSDAKCGRNSRICINCFCKFK